MGLNCPTHALQEMVCGGERQKHTCEGYVMTVAATLDSAPMPTISALLGCRWVPPAC